MNRREISLLILITFNIWVQFCLICAQVSCHVPVANLLAQQVVGEWQFMLRPEREAWLYHVFVLIAICLGFGLFFYIRLRRKAPKGLLAFACVEMLLTAAMMIAAFKATVYVERALLAQQVFIGISIVCILIKLCWKQVAVLGDIVRGRFLSKPFDRRWDIGFLIFIALFIFVPDSTAVLARMFFGEQYHHFDSFMAPIWAHASGCVLNMDVMTEYGIGLPIFVEYMAKLLGGLSYSHVFYVYVGMAVVYFMALFILLRSWLNSFWVAALSVVLCLKWQMFHPGVTPFVFTFPSTTVARFFFDIFFFIFIYQHLKTKANAWCLAAALTAGFMIFYMPTIGYCLAIPFFAYVLGCVLLPHVRHEIFKSKRQWLWVAAWVVAVPLSMSALLYATQGNAMFSPEFKANMGEFNHYFLSGFGLMPMQESLQNREVLASLMGFVIPLVYVLTIVMLGSVLIFNRGRRMLMLPVVICAYGVLTYHYYIARSAVTSYYVVCVPFVIIGAFWLQLFLNTRSRQERRLILSVLGLLLLGAVVSNHNVLNYPNVFNLSQNPITDQRFVQPLSDGRSYFNQLFSRIPDKEKLPVNNLGETEEGLTYERDYPSDKKLKEDYQAQSNFDTDVALIKTLTKPQEKVPLLSSFEIAMLMQAKRKPFFYYSPILIARPMRMRTFPNSTMYTFTHAARMIQDVERNKPAYIFMEKVFLQQDHDELYKDPGLLALMQYIRAHYSPQAQGRFLVAMRKI